MDFLYSQLFVKPQYPTKSFAGQTVIVTGANTGLGKEAARHFARLGASKLILAVRNIEAGEEAKKDIVYTTKRDQSVIEVWPLDLASYDSVKAFAHRALGLPRVDVLLENAGIAKIDFGRFEGHERTITVNVVSTFLLALLMLPRLKDTAREFNTEPHLTIVSSGAHGFTEFEEWKAPKVFEVLDDESKAKMSERYPVSKLLEVLLIRHIAPQLKGSGVIINCLSPGLCHSGISRDGSYIIEIMKFFIARSTEVGSRTLVAATHAGPESHGRYMKDGKVNDNALSSFVRSEDGTRAAKKVWNELSEMLESIELGVAIL